MPPDLVAIVDKMPLPMALVDVSGFRVRAANAPLLELAGMEAGELIGLPALEFASPEDRARVQADQEALADGRLAGFQAGRVFHLPNGTTVHAKVWARRIVVNDQAWGLAVVLPDEPEGLHVEAGLAARNIELVMAVTDHDWVIERVSADAHHVFGAGAEELLGQALLGTVHPDDAAGIAMWLTEAATSKSTLACRARLRVRGRDWRPVTCFVSALCAHSPPRLGLAVSRAPDEELSQQARPKAALEHTLWRTAMELRAAALTSEAPTAITRGPPERAGQLTSRQWEIVQRLAQGESPRKIASEMYLSPSTVRNQLVAIYRKFGVHSQVELLAAVRDQAVPWLP